MSPTPFARALKPAALLPLLLLTACATGGPVTIRGACDVFKPISSSVHDTKQTLVEVHAHNAVGTTVCGWKP